MGFSFRKRIKIAPGLHLNVGKRGVSASVGGRGATVNVGRKGAKATVGIPGTGISYSTKAIRAAKSKSGTTANRAHRASSNPEEKAEMVTGWNDEGIRPVSVWLGIGVFFIPFLFSWFLLRKGYSNTARCIAFGWMVLFLVAQAIR